MTIATPQWLTDAVIYEIYPQSFADSNGDGIGDLPGVISRLDYLQWLGVDAIWFNPCFASPFRDAGYDVSDYFSIAPRYGTNEDMFALVAEARSRGIRVILDLVAGHTSVEHPWFRASANDTDDDRYVWSDAPGPGFVRSPGTRPGWYLKNFFDEQPALNFGYSRLDPAEPWRQLPSDPGPRSNREALKEIIGFWLAHGIAGFRVDMAYSLVKDDPDLEATTALWRDISSWVRDEHPGCVLIPESDEAQTPGIGERGGFDADFALVIHREHSALFNNGGAGILPWQDAPEPCYFDAQADVDDGTRALRTFLQLWRARQDASGGKRPAVLPSSDHDFSRQACGRREGHELAAVFTFLLTWGSIPSVYYGDEIGMRFLEGLPDVEGSVWNPRFNRAGCRTPMQWDTSEPNDGFSSAAAAELYLPQDSAEDRPAVAQQRAQEGSLVNHVRDVIALRRATPALRTSAPTTVLAEGYPFAYLRGDRHLVVLNPRDENVDVPLPGVTIGPYSTLIGGGVSLASGTLSVRAGAHAILEFEHPMKEAADGTHA